MSDGNRWKQLNPKWKRFLPLYLSLLLGALMLVLSFSGLGVGGDRPMPLLSLAESSEWGKEVIDTDRRDIPSTPQSNTTLPDQSFLWMHEAAVPLTGDHTKLAPDIQAILERGTLRIALLRADEFPFFYAKDSSASFDTTETDHLEGIDIQITRSLATYLGVEPIFLRNSATFNGVIDQVFNQEADLAISKLSRTLDRARKVRYSHPYVHLRPGLLFNRLELSRILQNNSSQNAIEAIQNLGGQAHLGVIHASAYANFVRRSFPQATIVEYPGWDQLLEAIVHGNVLAGCRDELAIKNEMLQNSNANIQMQSVVMDGWMDEIAIALPWQSTQLTEFVNSYLLELQLSLTADQLLTHYLSVS